MPDVWVDLAGDAASEVGRLFGSWVDSSYLADLFFQVFHFVQQAVEEFRAARSSRHDHDRLSVPWAGIGEPGVELSASEVPGRASHRAHVRSHSLQVSEYLVRPVVVNREVRPYDPVVLPNYEGVPDHRYAPQSTGCLLRIILAYQQAKISPSPASMSSTASLTPCARWASSGIEPLKLSDLSMFATYT